MENVFLIDRVQDRPTDPLKEGPGKPQFRADCEAWHRMSVWPTPLTLLSTTGLAGGVFTDADFSETAIMAHQMKKILICICKLLPYELLFASKIIHEEVSSVLYSENMLKDCPTNRKGGTNGLSFL